MPTSTKWAEKKIRTEDHLERLVKRVRERDCERSFELLKRYLGYYISQFSRKYKIPGYDREEIEQECLCALRFKAIKDFNPKRGRFKGFAILCLKRHLYSIIKATNQQKRKVLNESISLDENRSEGGEVLSLASIIAGNDIPVDEQVARDEANAILRERLLSKCSSLEEGVVDLYVQGFHYDEIVEDLDYEIDERPVTIKTVDNSLQRARQKAADLAPALKDLFD